MDIFILVALFLFVWWVWDAYVVPWRMIRPPANKIISLVGNEEGFCMERGGPVHYDYLLEDTEDKKQTLLSSGFSGDSIRLSGDLDWMNEWESERLYEVVRGVINKRESKYKEACTIEENARNERRRVLAIETYKNR